MARPRTKINSELSREVEQEYKRAKNHRDKERLRAIHLAIQGGKTLAMIAEIVGRARSVIQQWIGKFEKGGIAGLLDRKTRPGRPTKITGEIREKIKEQLRQGTWRTAGQMRQWMKENFGIKLSKTSSYYWMGKCDGRLKAPRPCHRKQQPGASDAFKTHRWAEELKALNLPPGEPVQIWVMDESRFGLHTIVRHCWGLKGHRVVCPFQQRFQWEYVYGSLNVLTGEPVLAFLPTVSIDAVEAFLEEIVKTYPESHHVILWDGAGFHQPPAPENEALSKVHVIKLPPYSPELNPVEKLWDALKDTVCNKVFDTLDHLRNALVPTMKRYWEDNQLVKNLLGTNWLTQLSNA